MWVTTVQSTTLATVGYDHLTKLLRLQFHSRAVYYYRGVPVEVYRNLLQAPSKGAYFNRSIRGRFPFYRQPIGPVDTPTVGA